MKTTRATHGTAPALLLAALTFLAGGLLYVGYRPGSLLLFDWAEALQLAPAVAAIRLQAQATPLPDVIIYSAPAGLWAASFTVAIRAVWQGANPRTAAWWLILPCLIGCASELFQLAGICPGTFDPTDVATYVVGSAAGLFVPIHSAQSTQGVAS